MFLLNFGFILYYKVDGGEYHMLVEVTNDRNTDYANEDADRAEGNVYNDHLNQHAPIHHPNPNTALVRDFIKSTANKTRNYNCQ